jgi:hypothetical protein
MKSRRLLALSVLAFAFGCRDQKLPTAPTGPSAPTDPSAIISDGAHGGNPDFFFLPPMVPLPLHNPNFELGKFNNTLQPSLKIDICELKSENLNTRGLPTAATRCVAGDPLKTFAPGTVKLVNLPVRQNGWWNLFGLPPDGFYYVLWDTRQSSLNVNKYYRIKVLVAGPPDVVLGVADVDPMSSLFQWKYTLTGEVIQLINGFFLPIPFRVEKGGGPALCGGATLCTSATVTNLPPGGPDQIVRVQGADGSFIAGVRIPADFLPPPPGPQSVVLTISRVNTGANNVPAGTQEIPCHANLPLQQFNSCFHFSTIPELPLFPPGNEEGRQFKNAITVAVCFVLIDKEPLDSREPYVQLWSSDEGGENAKPLPSASDAQILTAGTGRDCGNNLVGFNNNSNGFTQLASAGWGKLKGGLGRLFGVQTAYAVDLGLGGFTFDLSNIGPALTARIEPIGNTDLGIQPPGGGLILPVRLVGTQVHNGGALTTGIGGLPVTFAVDSGTLLPHGAVPEVATPKLVREPTNSNRFDAENAASTGWAAVTWFLPSTPGPYTLTATGPATGGPVTFHVTVAQSINFNVLRGSWTNENLVAPGITRLNIGVDGSAVSVHAWAACNGEECDWGSTSANTTEWAPNLSVVAFWDQGFATRTQTITYVSATRLRVVTFTHFVPPNEGTDYTLTEFFTKDVPIP